MFGPYQLRPLVSSLAGLEVVCWLGFLRVCVVFTFLQRPTLQRTSEWIMLERVVRDAHDPLEHSKPDVPLEK